MRNPTCRQRADHRPAVVLLLVVSMLALFAVVGLSFVYYAEAEANMALSRRQTESPEGADLTPDRLLAYFLNELIFDTASTKSDMRGLSIARDMYGPAGSTVAYNGTGYLQNDKTRTLSTLKNQTGWPFDYINAPYTYADGNSNNSAFLAMLDPDGAIVERSFVRNKSTFSPFNGSLTNNSDEGEVKNLTGVKGGPSNSFNDSFWMNLGFPPMRTKDGVAYIPLFAPLILDLDGKINVNVIGNNNVTYSNYTTTGGAITSRSGLGPWEINPVRILAADYTTANRTTYLNEIKNLFQGNSNATTAVGRYGPTSPYAPDNSGSITAPSTPLHGQADLQGTGSNLQLPSGVTSFTMYPTYPATWNTVGSNHPAGFDYWAANPAITLSGSADQRLAPSNLEALLRWNEVGSASLTSDLVRLLPQNLNPADASNGTTIQKNMRLITPFSMSLDTVHLAPYFPSGTGAAYTFSGSTFYPQSSTAIATGETRPGSSTSATPGDYTSDLRNKISGELRRINLNRTLTAYSVGPPSTVVQADTDRQNLARDIFNRLVAVTGATASFSAATTKTDTSFLATRWLAQIAVNIVDYIDSDDVMTQLQWNTQDTNDYVYGFELPRVLINEVYASWDNDGTEPGLANLMMPSATKYRLNVWAELYNPMKNDANVRDSGTAYLRYTAANNSRVVYRLGLAKNTTGISTSATGTPTNLARGVAEMDGGPQFVDDFPAGASLLPGDATFSTVGAAVATAQTAFFTVGPKETNGMGNYFLNDPTGMYNLKPDLGNIDHRSLAMSVDVDIPAGATTFVSPYAPNLPVLFLQRLANPFLDPSATNPYVTVDYFQVQANNGVKFIADMDQTPSSVNSFKSYGRVQPLEAAQNPGTPAANEPAGNPLAQAPNPPVAPTGMGMPEKPQATFRQQNTTDNAVANVKAYPTNPNQTAKLPFDWLPHMDRPLLSIGELAHVVAVPPWDLTQRFPHTPHVLATPMADQQSLVYRFLETVTVPSRMYNSRTNGTNYWPILVPGRVNVNMIRDQKVLDALLDPQSDSSNSQNNSFFTSTDVGNLYTAIQSQRPFAGYSSFAMTNSMSTDYAQLKQFGGTSIFPTFTNDGKFYTSNAAEMFRKLTNNITFTSNTFAVWLTVGFFQIDPATGTVQQEIGKADNRQVRHRFFAIVDRSQLVVPDQQLTTLSATATAGTTTVKVNAASGNLGYGTVSNATNASPIVVTTSASHNLSTGDQILISGVQGNTAANGRWTVSVLSSTTFSLTGSTGNGNFTSAGYWFQTQPRVSFDWSLKAGTRIVIDRGTATEEAVEITAVAGTTLTTTKLAQTHANNATVHLDGYRGVQGPPSMPANRVILGYPGPQAWFNLQDYSYVVPYWTIID